MSGQQLIPPGEYYGDGNEAHALAGYSHVLPGNGLYYLTDGQQLVEEEVSYDTSLLTLSGFLPHQVDDKIREMASGSAHREDKRLKRLQQED